MNGTAPPRIGVTLGDPNGIGPEIAVKAALATTEARVLLIGDRNVIAHYAAEHKVREVDPAVLPCAEIGLIDVVPASILPDGGFTPGSCHAASGRAMIGYTKRAVELAQAGQIDAIVGGPHHEGAVKATGIQFSGYPSLIARLSNTEPETVFLMLVGGGLRIVHATLHERLVDALSRLDIPLVVAAARAAVSALQRLGIEQPRIGLFGINPHAGEDGLFGDDDAHVTIPAAAELRDAGMDVIGPLGADLMLGRQDCHAFVAAYHDQGHIPIKLLAGRQATALTIGADVLFASVGHGCAPDIAGKGIADPSAMLRAITLITMTRPMSEQSPSADYGAIQ